MASLPLLQPQPSDTPQGGAGKVVSKSPVSPWPAGPCPGTPHQEVPPSTRDADCQQAPCSKGRRTRGLRPGRRSPMRRARCRKGKSQMARLREKRGTPEASPSGPAKRWAVPPKRTAGPAGSPGRFPPLPKEEGVGSGCWPASQNRAAGASAETAAPWTRRPASRDSRAGGGAPGPGPSGLSLSGHDHAHPTPSRLSSHVVGVQSALGWEHKSWLSS